MTKVFLSLLISAALHAAPSTESRCGGGEGPKPMVDITAGFPANVHLIPTKGEVKEFVSWEKKQQIVYRNTNNQVFASTAQGEVKAQLTTSTKPMSRVTDPEERFLLISGERWFLDTWMSAKQWIHYTAPFNRPHHLFWNNRQLFSMSSPQTKKTQTDAGDDQWLKLYRYTAGDRNAKRICPLIKFDSGAGFRIGHGHTFPYVFLYKVSPTETGNEVTLFRLNVNVCMLQNLGTYKHKIQGDVQDVYWFPKLNNSFAVRVDHPRSNLLWDSGDGGCRYFDIGTSPMLILNYARPVVATMDEREGFSLWYLEQENVKRVKLLKDLPVSGLSASDVWLTRDGKQLFAAPQFADQSKWLLRIDLPEKPAEE